MKTEQLVKVFTEAYRKGNIPNLHKHKDLNKEDACSGCDTCPASLACGFLSGSGNHKTFKKNFEELVWEHLPPEYKI